MPVFGLTPLGFFKGWQKHKKIPLWRNFDFVLFSDSHRERLKEGMKERGQRDLGRVPKKDNIESGKKQYLKTKDKLYPYLKFQQILSRII